MIDAKICGITDERALRTACEAGASFVGFNFFPPSPRAVSPDQAAEFAAMMPAHVQKVGLFVDPSDEEIEVVLAKASLDLIQLHGSETVPRCQLIKNRFAIKLVKTIKIAGRDDFAQAEDFTEVADILLFDAKPPTDLKDALPGGNGLTFDWNLLRNRDWPIPWMLAGGLDAENVCNAVRLSQAPIVDVSSGVESAPGKKDPAKIKAFLDALKGL
jgi:phosphoribosylanthranilate isomerase